MIFVDSDAYIAINVEKDSLHKKAIQILKGLIAKEEEMVTSWQVVDEVATKLSYFTTKKKALEFLNGLLSSSAKVVHVESSMVPNIVQEFKSQTSKRVSLTDCTNMVIAKTLAITTFFSFDEHYEKNGFNLLSAKK